MNKDIKILAILGMTGSGKSVLVDYLTSRGIPKVHFGNMIYREMEKRGITRTPESEKQFRVEIRKAEGNDWVARQALAEAKDLIAAGQKRIVLDGLYSWTEYKMFKHEFPGSELSLVAVVVPRALRYERLAARTERPYTATESRERDYSEIEHLEKGGPIAIADYYVINDSTLDSLYAQFNKVLKELNF